MNKRHQDAIRPAIDARLSALVPDGQTAQRVLQRANHAHRAHRKLSAAPVFALVLLALAAVACAAAVRFGVLDFRHEQAENPAYVSSILRIEEHFENDLLTLDVNEAVFDGSRLDLTMDILHREGADTVYVIPSIKAQSGGKSLPVSVESVNFDFDDGFFLPEQQPLHAATEQAGISAIVSGAPQNDEIEWTLRFDVLRPLYPIEINKRSLDPEEGEEEIPFDVYIQDYIDAHADGIILLDRAGDLIMYDGALTMGAAFGESPWKREGFAERLIACGAFERAETFEAHFVTQAADVFAPRLPASFMIDECHEATLTRLDVTFARADYEIEVRRTDGRSAAQAYLDHEGYFEFALLADGAETRFLHGQTGPVMKDDALTGTVRLSGSVQLSGTPDALTIVPCFHDQKTAFPPDSMYAVYDAQRPLTDEQARWSFTIPIR